MTAAHTIPFPKRPAPKQPQPYRPPGCPDLAFIREHVPIMGVAEALGIRLSGRYRAHCWRVERHDHGDATPAITFDIKRNRGKCWVCDSRTWSVIDLVMMRLDVDMKAAVNWITERFPVPPLADGTHVRARQGWFPRFRAGINDSVQSMLVRSGLLADLSHAEKAVLLVLTEFTDHQNGYAEISYPGLMQYTGIGSRATIARAIRRFERMHVLRVKRSPKKPFFQGGNRYTMTTDDPQFSAMVAERFNRLRQEIAVQKELRAREKKKSSRSPENKF